MIQKLNEFMEESVYYYELPGLCFSVRRGEFEYEGVVGYRNYRTKEPLQIGDVFHMASVSKLFTGAGILDLYEQSQVDLNEKIANILPWLKIRDDRLEEISLLHMLTHTSGMPDVSNHHWDNPDFDIDALKRYAQSSQVREAKLFWSPRENKFRYSDMAYELLGCAIAEISGLTYEGYMEKRFFEPLDMTNTTFLTPSRNVEELPKPHGKDEKNHIYVEKYYPYNRAHSPSSTLTTDGPDIHKWAKAHIDKKVFKRETYELMWKQYTEIPNNGEGMGLSWFLRKQKGLDLMGHEGTDTGFRSSFWICPDKDISISVMSNITKAPVKRLSKGIFDILLG